MINAMASEAWRAMGANRMRAFLTMLGMMIGVAAVIMMLAVGRGTQYAVEQSIAAMGSNLFIVLAGSTTETGLRLGSGNAPTLTVADADAMAELPEVAGVAPVSPGSAQIVYGSNNWGSMVTGTNADYINVGNWRLAEGEMFSDADVRSASRVAVLGQTVVKNLFGDESPVGKTIRIRQSPFLVVGTLAPKGQSLDGRDQDDTVFIPILTAQRKVFGNNFRGSVRYIMVKALSAQTMPAAEESMRSLLRQRHRLTDRRPDDFTIRNLTAAANAQAATTKMMSIMLGAIASVSLLVGGIGIMNIMLVSVTERTREIGIRIAIGARERDIRLQFLLEAIFLSLIGSVVGVLLGVGAAAIANAAASLTVVVTAGSILLAFCVATAVGIFFGYYPANKAAQLKPIDALRYQ
jgi:putative ABC transport system permease protein